MNRNRRNSGKQAHFLQFGKECGRKFPMGIQKEFCPGIAKLRNDRNGIFRFFRIKTSARNPKQTITSPSSLFFTHQPRTEKRLVYYNKKISCCQVLIGKKQEKIQTTGLFFKFGKAKKNRITEQRNRCGCRCGVDSLNRLLKAKIKSGSQIFSPQKEPHSEKQKRNQHNTVQINFRKRLAFYHMKQSLLPIFHNKSPSRGKTPLFSSAGQRRVFSL